jgi:hypothetical protein
VKIAFLDLEAVFLRASFFSPSIPLFLPLLCPFSSLFSLPSLLLSLLLVLSLTLGSTFYLSLKNLKRLGAKGEEETPPIYSTRSLFDESLIQGAKSNHNMSLEGRQLALLAGPRQLGLLCHVAVFHYQGSSFLGSFQAFPEL